MIQEFLVFVHRQMIKTSVVLVAFFLMTFLMFLYPVTGFLYSVYFLLMIQVPLLSYSVQSYSFPSVRKYAVYN